MAILRSWTKNVNKRLHRECAELPLAEILDKLRGDFANVKMHVNLKRIQQQAFSADIRYENTRVIQMRLRNEFFMRISKRSSICSLV